MTVTCWWQVGLLSEDRCSLKDTVETARPEGLPWHARDPVSSEPFPLDREDQLSSYGCPFHRRRTGLVSERWAAGERGNIFRDLRKAQAVGSSPLGHPVPQPFPIRATSFMTWSAHLLLNMGHMDRPCLHTSCLLFPSSVPRALTCASPIPGLLGALPRLLPPASATWARL